MASRSPRLRVVGPGETRRRAKPGAAVIAVVAYATVFGAGLWVLRSRSAARPEGSASSRSTGPAAPQPAATNRGALLRGAGLSAVARDQYFRELSAECCSCGCDLNVRDCLLSDQQCSRSPEVAAKLLERLK